MYGCSTRFVDTNLPRISVIFSNVVKTFCVHEHKHTHTQTQHPFSSWGNVIQTSWTGGLLFHVVLLQRSWPFAKSSSNCSSSLAMFTDFIAARNISPFQACTSLRKWDCNFVCQCHCPRHFYVKVTKAMWRGRAWSMSVTLSRCHKSELSAVTWT